jgi:hypothetical protein
MRRRSVLLLPLALGACAATPSGRQRFKGVWDFHFETSAFTTEDGAGPYWLSADGATWEALSAPFGEVGSPWGRVAIEIEGELSAPGGYGHLGTYARELVVTRVLSARLIEADRPSRQNLPVAPPRGNN